MASQKSWDREFSVRSWTSSVDVENKSLGGEPYSAGYITSPHGVVGFYTQSGQHPYTSLVIVFDGLARERNWQGTFSKRGLKTVAKRFAAEIAALQPKGIGE